MQDAMGEERIIDLDGILMTDLLKQVKGEIIWMETPNWVYAGYLITVGRDFVRISQAIRMPADGRHNVMMRTGRHNDIEIEATGGPDRIIVIPIDWFGPWCVWNFPESLVAEAV